ncbi:MAG: flippase-like domain-containing protein [Pirellulaceae bacterium]|nr:flippase-like domain-containing protein [Pirellulaceae bacterium]
MSRTTHTAPADDHQPPTGSHWKRVLLSVLKYGISLSILGYLFYKASQDQSFEDLMQQPKNWGLLVVAFGFALGAVLLTTVRWYLLVRSLHIPFTLRDSFRLGFVGYLFNFLSLGVVGGDLLKAVFLARQQPQRRPEAIASVIVDRVLGLYALFLLAAVAFLSVDLEATAVRDPRQLEFIQLICRVTFGFTVAGAVGLGILFLPGFTTAPFWDLLVHLPKIGPTLERLIGALRMYRRQPGLLLLVLLISLVTHAMFVMSIYMIARGLPGDEPTLATHFVIVPIANVAGAVPLPGGMGPFEYTLDMLYRGVSSAAVAPRQGFVIAMAFRVITLIIAMVGVVYYLTSRREVSQLLKDADPGAALDETDAETPTERPREVAAAQSQAGEGR